MMMVGLVLCRTQEIDAQTPTAPNATLNLGILQGRGYAGFYSNLDGSYPYCSPAPCTLARYGYYDISGSTLAFPVANPSYVYDVTFSAPQYVGFSAFFDTGANSAGGTLTSATLLQGSTLLATAQTLSGSFQSCLLYTSRCV